MYASSNVVGLVDGFPICTDHKMKLINILKEIKNNNTESNICQCNGRNGKCSRPLYKQFFGLPILETKRKRYSRCYSNISADIIPSTDQEITQFLFDNPNIKFVGLCPTHLYRIDKKLKDSYTSFADYINDYNAGITAINTPVVKKPRTKKVEVVQQEGEATPPAENKCSSTTKAGTPCKNNKCNGHEVCYTHMTKEQKQAYSAAMISN
jgi:hypothetical protein